MINPNATIEIDSIISMDDAIIILQIKSLHCLEKINRIMTIHNHRLVGQIDSDQGCYKVVKKP